MPDTITEVKAILARTLHDLEQVIDNPGVKSLLHGLGRLLGIEDDAAATTTKRVSRPTSDAKPKPVAASRTRTPPAPRVASSARASSAARQAGGNGRREQLLALVVDQPGITVPQAAKQFGLKDGTGLYGPARRLQDDGLVRKRGAELHPTAKAKR